MPQPLNPELWAQAEEWFAEACLHAERMGALGTGRFYDEAQRFLSREHRKWQGLAEYSVQYQAFLWQRAHAISLALLWCEDDAERFLQSAASRALGVFVTTARRGAA